MERPRIRHARTPKRRRDILDASLQCFLKHGIEAATIEQIRLRSGASSGSIYHHFGSKHGIAIALYVEGQEQLAELFREAMEQHHSLAEGITAIVNAYFQWVAENPDWAMYLLRVATADLSVEDATQVAEVNHKIRDDLTTWLRPFAERGEIAQIPEDLYANIVHGSISHFARHWLTGRQQLDLATAAACLARSTIAALTMCDPPASGRSVKAGRNEFSRRTNTAGPPPRIRET